MDDVDSLALFVSPGLGTVENLSVFRDIHGLEGMELCSSLPTASRIPNV
jgi:hypothetical protein